MSKIIPNSDIYEKAKPYTMESIPEDHHRIGNSDGSLDASHKIKGDKILAAEKEAYKRGYDAGEKVGRETTEKKVEEVINNISYLLDGLRSLNRQIYEEGEVKIVTLAICIAEKVIHSELKQNPEVIVNVVRAALKKVLDREMIKIKVNPNDFEILNRYRPELMASTNGKKGPTIEWDDSIMPGGCLIETNHGEVDARLDKQLEEISLELKEEMDRNGPGKEDR